MTHSDAIVEAKRLAAAGYGSEDIVVMVQHLLSLETAKQIVREAEGRSMIDALAQISAADLALLAYTACAVLMMGRVAYVVFAARDDGPLPAGWKIALMILLWPVTLAIALADIAVNGTQGDR